MTTFPLPLPGSMIPTLNPILAQNQLPQMQTSRLKQCTARLQIQFPHGVKPFSIPLLKLPPTLVEFCFPRVNRFGIVKPQILPVLDHPLVLDGPTKFEIMGTIRIPEDVLMQPEIFRV